MKRRGAAFIACCAPQLLMGARRRWGGRGGRCDAAGGAVQRAWHEEVGELKAGRAGGAVATPTGAQGRKERGGLERARALEELGFIRRRRRDAAPGNRSALMHHGIAAPASHALAAALHTSALHCAAACGSQCSAAGPAPTCSGHADGGRRRGGRHDSCTTAGLPHARDSAGKPSSQAPAQQY